MRSENRIRRSIHQTDIFASELANLRDGQTDIKEVLATILHRIVKQCAEYTWDELRVCRELSKLPESTLVRRHIHTALICIETFLSEKFLILAQLVQAFENVAFLVAVRVADPIHGAKYSCYLSHRLTQFAQLSHFRWRQLPHTQRH